MVDLEKIVAQRFATITSFTSTVVQPAECNIIPILKCLESMLNNGNSGNGKPTNSLSGTQCCASPDSQYTYEGCRCLLGSGSLCHPHTFA